MSRGEYAGFGKPENTAELAPLLSARALKCYRSFRKRSGPKKTRDNRR
jgi:hypothetical protein